MQGGSKEKTLRTPQVKGDYIRNRVHSDHEREIRGEYEIQKVLEIVCETRWRWSRVAIARHRNRKGNDVVRIDNM